MPMRIRLFRLGRAEPLAVRAGIERLKPVEQAIFPDGVEVCFRWRLVVVQRKKHQLVLA